MDFDLNNKLYLEVLFSSEAKSEAVIRMRETSEVLGVKTREEESRPWASFNWVFIEGMIAPPPNILKQSDKILATIS